MHNTLQEGMDHTLSFRIPQSKTVPSLYPESEEFQEMPEVFATGFFIGLVEWASIQLVNPHLNWPQEQTVGIHVDISHEAATPPGLEVIVNVELTEVNGRKLVFQIEAHDGIELIGQGTHERFIINATQFSSNTAKKSN